MCYLYARFFCGNSISTRFFIWWPCLMIDATPWWDRLGFTKSKVVIITLIWKTFYHQPAPWMGMFKILLTQKYSSACKHSRQSRKSGPSRMPLGSSPLYGLGCTLLAHHFDELVGFEDGEPFAGRHNKSVYPCWLRGHQLQERARRIRERKAAIDVGLIVGESCSAISPYG